MWCCIYFSCSTASGGDEMKEKQYNREKRAGGEREERGVLLGASKWKRRRKGMCAKKRRKVRRKRETEYDYMEREQQKWKWLLERKVWGESQKKKKLRVNRREMKGKKDGGQRSHSHVEDGLLVSHHLAISHRQGVIASLQVKILKCQLDHLDNSRDITETTVSDRHLNALCTRCRGETPSHLWLSICLSSIYLSISSEYCVHFHPHTYQLCVF